MKQKLIKNTLYNIISYGYSAIIGFFLVPFVIKNIGLNRYGIWSLITMITGYFSLIDFGIGQSFERYIAEYKAKNDIKNLNYVVNSGLLIYLLLFFILIPLSIISLDFLIKILKIPQEFSSEAKFIFKWAIIYIGFSNIFGLFYSCMRGFQRMDITGKVTIFLTTFHAIGVILFLKHGWGLKGLMVNNFLVYSIGGLTYIFFLNKIFPDIRLNLLLFEKAMLKRLSKFGIKRWITSIEEVITYQTDKFFISHFLNVSLVGIYQIGYTIPEKVSSMIRLLNSAVVPASAELNTMDDKEKIVKLYSVGLRYISFVTLGLFSFIIINSSLIIITWIGESYNLSSIILKLFSIAFIMISLGSIPTAIAVGIEKPEFQMVSAIIQTTMNFILTLILILKIGIIGVVIATLISVSFSTCYIFLKLNNYLKISFKKFFTITKIHYAFLLSSTICLLLVIIKLFLPFLYATKVKNLLFLLIEFLIFVIIYLFSSFKLNLIEINEIRLLKYIKKNRYKI